MPLLYELGLAGSGSFPVDTTWDAGKGQGVTQLLQTTGQAQLLQAVGQDKFTSSRLQDKFSSSKLQGKLTFSRLQDKLTSRIQDKLSSSRLEDKPSSRLQDKLKPSKATWGRKFSPSKFGCDYVTFFFTWMCIHIPLYKCECVCVCKASSHFAASSWLINRAFSRTESQ